MANLTIEMPDDLARGFEGLAALRQKTVQDIALEGLRSLIESSPEPQIGSAAVVLRAMREPPYPTASEVAELDEAIRAGRLPVSERDLFA